MKKKLYIGVDGGGTKTEVLIQDENAKELGFGRSGAGNIKTSVEGSLQSFHEALAEAMSQANLGHDLSNYQVFAGFGMAGVEVVPAREAFEKRVQQLGFEMVIVQSDAYVACLGAHAGKDGAIIIIGTGVHGRSLEDGVEKRVGGWGFPHSDEGGGAWLGLQAIALAFRAIDGRGEKSLLLDAIIADFPALPEMVRWANAGTPLDYGRLAPKIFEWKDKDPLALTLIKKAAKEIDEVWQALQKGRGDKMPLPLVLLGGLAPLLQPYLSREVQAVVVDRKMSAPEGAILMMRKKCGEF